MDLPQQMAAFPQSQSWHKEILGDGRAGALHEIPKKVQSSAAIFLKRCWFSQGRIRVVKIQNIWGFFAFV